MGSPSDRTNEAGEVKVDHGRRLPTAVIDDRAVSGHQRPAALIPKSSRLDDGYQPVSFGKLANAINRCAFWLRDKFGTGRGETLAYLGVSDLRYLIIAWAAVKSGHIVCNLCQSIGGQF